MALKAKHKKVLPSGEEKETEFGVGDRVRISQKIQEAGKERLQAFEGIVIRIKGREKNKSFTVRRIGVQQVGIERIFPLASPFIENIEVVKRGMRGVRRAKLYYIREKHRREIEKIYSRSKIREQAKKQSAPTKAAKVKGSKGKLKKKVEKKRK